MFSLIGAAGALSYLTSLLQSSTSGKATSAGSNPLSALEQSLTGESGTGVQPQAVTGSGTGASPLSSGTLAALIALQGQGGANGPGGLFAQLDSNGDGQISQSEFENTLGSAGVDTSSADALFAKLDANGDGQISQSELAAARHGHGHHHMHGAGGQGGMASLLNGTDVTGASTQTTTNTDGSSTTTTTYADGSTVSMTTPAASQDGGVSGSGAGQQGQFNLLEQLIKLQSQLVAQSTAAVSTTA
jgi:EF-hand domain pair